MKIMIDVDNNVDIPIPENLTKNPQPSKRSKTNKKVPLKKYIYIDDDEDDESPNNHHPNDAAKHSPVKLSKNKRTYPGKDPNNCHGFSKQSNGDPVPSADNGSKLDSKGSLQKLWEKASLKKKASVQSDSDLKVVISDNSKSTETPPTDGVLVEGSIVDERGKVKEAAEYTLAIEEKLSDREKALKVQAEEAQRLLKRKEAEKLRLFDIKRRQRQRITEIRETQKKEKENTRLKEIYRTKVQHNLKNLEMTCHDMASLLGGLGILVDNGAYVSSNQIRVAYKRALLRFHPDRSSGSDMHQQVEAEEKFKLISRMRDKFL